MALTRIPITSLETGTTEQETQAIIDQLQAMGWNCFWGIGQRAYCSDEERRAFEQDFFTVIAAVKGALGMNVPIEDLGDSEEIVGLEYQYGNP